MQLDTFILSNLGLIVDDWETCAREIVGSVKIATSFDDLRRHSLKLVAAIAEEMRGHHISAATSVEPRASTSAGGLVEAAAAAYAASRHAAGLTADQLIRELSLLRGIVSSLWRQTESKGEASEAIVGLGRFNEAVDRVLGLAVRDYRPR